MFPGRNELAKAIQKTKTGPSAKNKRSSDGAYYYNNIMTKFMYIFHIGPSQYIIHLTVIVVYMFYMS